MKLIIQKVMLVVFVLASIIIPAILFAGASGSEAPFVTLRNKKIADGMYINDATTSTITAMKCVAFTATAANWAASVTFGTGFFKSASTYWVIANSVGTTYTASAIAITNNTGNSCTVYTSGVTDVVHGFAIGY